MPSRLYTRTGDKGTTRLGTGERVDKQSRRVAAYGSLYELNTTLGHARSLIATERPREPTELWNDWESALKELQHRLFLVGRDLSSHHDQETATTEKRHTDALEQLIDQLRAVVPPWRPFTVPEGTPAATALYMTTTVCRRAERDILTLNQDQAVPQTVMMWVNRLSDFFFMSGRFVNWTAGIAEDATRDPEKY